MPMAAQRRRGREIKATPLVEFDSRAGYRMLQPTAICYGPRPSDLRVAALQSEG
jgi:hypothetical protein